MISNLVSDKVFPQSWRVKWLRVDVHRENPVFWVLVDTIEIYN